MLKNLLIILCLSLVLLVNTACEDHQEKKEPAILAAESWLHLVDEEKYAESWDEASKYFRDSVSKEKWEQMVSAVRKPLGKVISRKLKNSSYKTALPGAPDGEYVVIQFNTSFENKKSSVETITPMLGKDNKWRVSGYYIK